MLRPPSAEAVAAPPGVRFSPFVPAHVEGALELVALEERRPESPRVLLRSEAEVLEAVEGGRWPDPC